MPERKGELSVVYVPSAEELIDKAFRRGARARKGKPKRTRIERARAEESMVMTVGNILSDNLMMVVRSFPSIDTLPPLYRELIDVLVGVVELKKALSSVNWASKKVSELKKSAIPRIRYSEDPSRIRREALGRMASVVKSIDPALRKLREARRHMRNIPDVGDYQTIVVAGYPNVGKSSFVRAITKAKPEIAPYPFTTKGIVVGHFAHEGVRYQVIDTPGLLDRPLSKRNWIERQAIAVLGNVGDVVLYMVDPTESCGYSVSEQLSLLSEIRESFSKPILVVATKRDIPAPLPPECELELTIKDEKSVETVKRALIEKIK
ncbi:GTP-binding protein [Methanosarcinales archaeon]|nr:MAG: GTP-binding protein [Methanosarcinales archaeon]